MNKTRAEIDALISNWKADPIWDIEDTDGFEAHRDELLAVHEAYLAECAADRQSALMQKAEDLGVPGNLKLAEYITRLERRLEEMNGALESIYFNSTRAQGRIAQFHEDW